MLNLIDSTATNTSVVVAATTAVGVPGSLMLENVIVDASVAAVSSLNKFTYYKEREAAMYRTKDKKKRARGKRIRKHPLTLSLDS